MKRLQIILLCFLFSAGCAVIQIERRVDGNVFYSSRLPKLTMSVDNSLKYIGEQKSKEMHTNPDFADVVDISAYPFVKVKENNFIQQMLIIMFMKFEDTTSFIRSIGGEKKVKVGGKKYKAFAGVGNIKQWFDALKINFLSESGYFFSAYYGGMRLARILDRGTWMYIVYLEEVSPSINFTEYKETVLERGLLAFEINGQKKETDPNKLLDEGYVLFKEGQYDRAIVYYNKAIEINPRIAKAYYNRGDAYYYKGYYDKAFWEYNKAIEINPNYSYAYNNRGLVYCHKGKFDKAISEYNKAIELNPSYAYPYDNRGYTYYLKGQYDKAIADCTKSIELNPKYAKAYYNRASAYFYKELYEKSWNDVHEAQNLGYKVPPGFLKILREASGRQE